jgi:hypothetical protein
MEAFMTMKRRILGLGLLVASACGDDGSLGDISEGGSGTAASESGTSAGSTATSTSTSASSGSSESGTSQADSGSSGDASSSADESGTAEASSGGSGESTGGMAGPTDGQLDDACAPNDGPATELMFGTLGTCPADEPTIRLVFFSGFPAVGVYAIASQADGFGEVVLGADPPVDVSTASVEITALGGGVASGNYDVVTEDAQHFVAEFTDIPYCESGFPCG